MTSSYCQPNESIFWFPVGPGITTLPSLPGESINANPRPANSVAVPPGFDIDNPDLCELFDDILPVGTDPVYARQVTVGAIVPPYFEIVYYDFRVRSLLDVTVYNYDLTPLTTVDLKVTTNIYFASYPSEVTIPVKTTVSSIEVELTDYQIAILATRLKVSASFASDPDVLLHFDGEVQGTNFINYGTLTSAVITSSGDPFLFNDGKFGGSSVLMYANPSCVTVTDPGLVLNSTTSSITFTGWIYFDSELATGRFNCIMSPGSSLYGSVAGIFAYISSGYNYISIRSGSSSNTLYLPDDNDGTELQNKWIFWSMQKNADTQYWTFHFSTYGTSYVYLTPSSSWYNSNSFSFGGTPYNAGTTYLPLYGRMDEIAIFRNIGLYSESDFASSDIPSSPYPPSSGFFSEVVTTRLGVQATYQAVLTVTTVTIPIYTKFAKAYRSTNAIVKVVDYTGTGASRTVATPGIEPSFIIIKNLTSIVSNYSPALLDASRGVGFYNPFSVGITDQTLQIVSAFNTSGITINTNYSNSNSNGVPYRLIAFGNTFDSYEDSSGTMPVTILRNPDFGFSICKYFSNGDPYTDAYIPHGLEGAPDLILTKPNNSVRPMFCGSVFGNNKAVVPVEGNPVQDLNYISYNSNYVITSSSASINYLNRGTNVRTMSYCFKSVSGKTKFGIYSGMSLFSKTVDVGFAPSLVIIRRLTGETPIISVAYSAELNVSWRPFYSSIETGYTSDISVTSTGFTVPASSEHNLSGAQYLYMAFRDAIV